MEESGQTITFEPGVPHLVLPGPKSILFTVTYGDAVPNPDRGNNDWWPVERDFSKRVRAEKRIAEGIIRTKFR